MFGECRQGLNVMKYALNHEKEFENPKIVWFIGFMQFVMVITVETINMANICGSDDILDVIMNFIALAIVADFDDFFFKALPNNLIRVLDMKLLVKHTSSNRSMKNIG